MDVIKTIAPGKPGTKRFERQWGSSLVAVRYRRNLETSETYTTVEIIVDKRPYLGKEVRQNGFPKYKKHDIVALHIGFNEAMERQRVKQFGARWSGQQKLWLMKYEYVVKLGYTHRIIHGAAHRCTDIDISLM